MALTMTSTQTVARAVLLRQNIREFLQMTTAITPARLELIVKGVEERRVSAVGVYGLDSNSQSRAEIIVSIDWDEHDRQVLRGQSTLIPGGRGWVNEMTVELHTLAVAFREFADEMQLSTEWRVWILPTEAQDPAGYRAAQRQLDVHTSRTLTKYPGVTSSREYKSVATLSELGIRLELSCGS